MTLQQMRQRVYAHLRMAARLAFAGKRELSNAARRFAEMLHVRYIAARAIAKARYGL